MLDNILLSEIIAKVEMLTHAYGCELAHRAIVVRDVFGRSGLSGTVSGNRDYEDYLGQGGG